MTIVATLAAVAAVPGHTEEIPRYIHDATPRDVRDDLRVGQRLSCRSLRIFCEVSRNTADTYGRGPPQHRRVVAHAKREVIPHAYD